jgi:hypothetical protein
MKERLIAERLLYVGTTTRPWLCHGCKRPQPQGVLGYYYNIAHPCEPGKTICEPCVDAMCLRLEGKQPAIPVRPGYIADLFAVLSPWERQ